ncbi:MAG: TrbG/VirB9 family P-type conjugative transfer protein [Rickettsiales bacterium]|jgi:type IV secretion system protein VirB9|nr:TrbG/VirB9 family P-type conjugative transfer protein [Rickettsiales bacterium]
MKKAVLTMALLALSLPCYPALADGAEPSLPSDQRIVILPYDESDVYTITTKYGYQTSLVFGRDESIETISVGDRSLWQIIPSGQRLFIRPMDDDVITNMTIITNRRSYQFDLKSLPSDSKEKPLYVVRFKYPEPKKKSLARMAEPAPAAIETPMPPKGFTPAPVNLSQTPRSSQTINYNYTYSGPDALAPVKVYDDGCATYFQYRSLGKNLPRIYIIAAGEPEREIVFYSKGNDLVVDEVAGEFVMRHANGAVTVYNEVLNPR